MAFTHDILAQMATIIMDMVTETRIRRGGGTKSPGPSVQKVRGKSEECNLIDRTAPQQKSNTAALVLTFSHFMVADKLNDNDSIHRITPQIRTGGSLSIF